MLGPCLSNVVQLPSVSIHVQCRLFQFIFRCSEPRPEYIPTHPLFDAVVCPAAHQAWLPSKEVQGQQGGVMCITQHMVQAALL
jgi:hypothetical protein